MPPDRHHDPRSIPLDGLIFGFGPMLPFAAAALGAWTLPAPWPGLGLKLAVIWGGLILSFLGGVRRGFGFGAAGAATPVEIVTMLLYVVPAGLALVSGAFGAPRIATALLAFGFTLVLIGDTRAARRGDAPRFFARLRPPQMAIAVLSLIALTAHG